MRLKYCIVVLSVGLIGSIKQLSKVAVIIFSGQRVRELKETVNSFYEGLDDTWNLQIFYDKISREEIFSIFTNLTKKRLHLSYIGSNIIYNRDTLQDYMVLNTSFWEAIMGEKILIFHSDSGICKRTPYSIHMFLDYDYIGAPFYMDWLLPGPFKPIEKNDITFYGGNGGLSLRSRSSMIECSKAAVKGSGLYWQGRQEDVYFSWCVKYFLSNQKLPPRNVSRLFAVETILESDTPWGFHKSWDYMNKNSYSTFREYCPEVERSRKIHKPMNGISGGKSKNKAKKKHVINNRD